MRYRREGSPDDGSKRNSRVSLHITVPP